MSRNLSRRVTSATRRIVAAFFAWCVLTPLPATPGTPAGYTEYIIPFDEDVFVYVTDPLVNVNPIPGNRTTASSISLTVWSDNTAIYVDHWEDGYEINFDTPDAAFDEKYSANLGQTLNFISPAIPRPRTGADGNTYVGSPAGDCNAQPAPAGVTLVQRNTANYCYDGRDYILVVGGASTMTRGGWIEGDGTPNNLGARAAIGEEVYPLAPQLIKYIVPFGEGNPAGNSSFERVIAVVQATEDNTELRLDFDGDGTFDSFSHENGYRTARNAGVDGLVLTLQKGQTYVFDRASDGNAGLLLKGGVILGSKTLQVEYFYGEDNSSYDTRAVAAYPRGFWGKEYYAVVDGAGGGYDTDILLYNPDLTASITMTWRTLTGSGTFTLAAQESALFSAKTGGFVPQGSSVYITGTDKFWGFSDIDINSASYDWGYSLMPDYLLSDEQTVAYAPGNIENDDPVDFMACDAAEGRDQGIFVTPVYDNTTFFIDKNGDNIPDSSTTGGFSPGTAPYDDSIEVLRGTATVTATSSGGYVANRLESLYITGSNVGDLVGSDCNLTGARIWATGPFTMAYGENPDKASGSGGLDLGYTVLPNPGDWMDLVLTVDKSTNPVVLSTAAGATLVTYTLDIKSHEFEVDALSVVDTLPANWAYQTGTTTITLPNLTTITGASANPTVSGGGLTLTWGTGVLGSLLPNQTLRITFQARTTADFAAGALTRNQVQATGTRTVGGVSQTFNARDFVFNTYRSTQVGLNITKASSVPEPTPVSPGDTLTYTVTVTNPSTSTAALTNLWINDIIPNGVTYVQGSGLVNGCYAPTSPSPYLLDQFGASSYSNSNGSVSWPTSWTETDPFGSGATGPGSGLVLITGGALQFRYQAMNVADNFDASSVNGYANSTGNTSWSGAWTETGDDGNRATGTITADTGGNNRANFGPGAAGRALTRSLSVAGTGSVTIGFALSDNGIDPGEGIIAEYDIGAGFVVMQQIDNNTFTGTNPVTVDTTGASTLTIRFRTFGTWANGNDNAGVDNVNVAFNNAVGSQIVRTADLSTASNALLTFTTAQANLDAGATPDTMVVEAATSPAGPFTVLATATNGAFAPAIGSGYDLTPYLSTTTSVRFRVTTGFEATDETRDFDDVRIDYTTAGSPIGSFASGNPPAFLGGGNAFDGFDTAGSATGGTGIWAAGWTESDEGTPGFSNGDIHIANGRLEFRAGTDATNRWAQRTATVAGASQVVLSYSYSNVGLDTGEGLTVQWSNDGTSWNTVNTIDDNTHSSAPPHTIAWTPTDTTLYVRYTAFGGYDGGENAYIDNVQVVIADTTCMVPVNSSVTLTFDVTVDDPFPTGQTEIVNTATSAATEVPIPQSASVRNIVVVPTSGSASVGDRVWLDSNGDGLLGPGEAGIPGVQVTLKDQWGTPLRVTTTDSQGRYIFIDVEPGTGYFVEVTDGLPAGLTQTTDARTDLRTNSFNLADGQNYLDADLGFRASAGTATIGDTVWIDFDRDQFRDPGEVGIGGVTVQLWEDMNGDGLITGADQLRQSAVTDAAGLYLFSNIPANGVRDYVVTLSTTQPPLTGYTPTTITSFLYQNLPALSTRVDADFGFAPGGTTPATLYSIADRVWLDNGIGGGTASDGLQNGTEAGIPGVTVSLLNAAGVTIATTTTGANGNFSFPGVPGGQNYTWRVTDDDHVLADLFGTTASALAGQFQMTGNLSSNLDYTTTPHFGYNATRAIGDTVWNDLNGNGTQQAGEPGIGGVTVLLYRDLDGDAEFEPGGDDGASIGSVVTTSTGFYIFSGLASGQYWVSIDNTQAALASFDTLTTGDNDTTSAPGHQRRVTPALSAGSSRLDIDYGYRASTAYAVSGRLWNDANNNGADDTEPGFGNVTLELLNSSGAVVATTTSASDGTYSFQGLPAGTYTVRFTDTAGVLTGFRTTFEKSEGALAGSYDGQETVSVGPSVTDVNFGFYNPFRFLTLAVVSLFEAHRESGQVAIRWETSAEIGTIGFDLFRFDRDAKSWIQVNEALLPSLLGNQQGGSYRFVDDEARPGETYFYLLVEVEASGKRNEMGPYRVNTDFTRDAAVGKDRRRAQGRELAQRFDRSPRVTRQKRDETRGQRTVWSRRLRDKPKPRHEGDLLQVKVAVPKTGIYYVPLAAAVEAGLKAGRQRLAVTHGGKPVDYAATGDGAGLYFYGRELDSPYASHDVFWLGESRAASNRMRVRRDRGAAASGLETFPRTVHVEQDLMPTPHLFTDASQDWSLWDFMFGGGAVKLYGFRADSATGAGPARLTVRLQGGSDTTAAFDHRAVVKVNGQPVGEMVWDGLEPKAASFDFDPSLLVDGENRLEIEPHIGQGAPYSVVYMDSFEVTYESRYRARGNQLECSTGSNASVLISGFTRGDVMVFDVTDPKRPVVVSVEARPAADGTFAVALQAPAPDTRFFALTPDALVAGEVAPGAQTALRQTGNAAEYLVVTTQELKPAAQALADYRGMSSMVVDIQDVYDEFGYGVPSPHALKAFLSYAFSSWATAPRFVVLAGHGTFDYKDSFGMGGNLIPPMMISTPDGLAPSDVWFADVDPSGPAPEMAIGRLPVLTPAELEALVRKIQQREDRAGLAWAHPLVAAADNPDQVGAFPADSDRIMAQAPQLQPERIYLSDLSIAAAREQLLKALNEGAGMVSYVGHAGYDVLADERLFTSSDVLGLVNDGLPTVLTAMTCVAGDFAMPFADAVGEELVQKTEGGAAAVWAPSRLSEHEHAVFLAERYFGAVFGPETPTMGEAITAAMRDYEQQPWRPHYMLHIYNLLGDPAMRLAW